MTAFSWSGRKREMGLDTFSILVVDDEPDIRAIVTVCLSKIGGWLVRTADSGPAGIEAALEWQPDAVLLDMMMPGMDGIGTLRELNANPRTAAIPVIFSTAKVREDEIARYRSAGARGVIAKPFDPMSLCDQITGVLASRLGGPEW